MKRKYEQENAKERRNAVTRIKAGSSLRTPNGRLKREGEALFVAGKPEAKDRMGGEGLLGELIASARRKSD